MIRNKQKYGWKGCSYMALVVAKFGGTSVATPDRIKAVAGRLVKLKEAGNDVVAVVSAMGKTTDELIELIHSVASHPSGREYDMLVSTGERVTMALLAMAIQELGHQAMSFTGSQAGIITDNVHMKAKITALEAARVKDAVASGNIAIVAGFQGVSSTGEITTLGRGGSDTTAVAIAAGIRADLCEICTAVSGVYTADPHVVPLAKKIDRISYEEMLEMAASGAGVLSMRSVEFARNHHVTLHCCSSFSQEPGTLITNEESSMENAIVSGVVFDTNDGKITIRGVEDRPGIAAVLFGALAKENVNVDMVIQNVSESGLTDISFTAPHDDLERARTAIESVVKDIGARAWVFDEDVAKVSIIGAGMRTHPGVTAKMCRALADAGINIDLISTSPIRLSCIIALDDVERAVRVLHTAFGLDKE
jgi:aspartate kinase